MAFIFIERRVQAPMLDLRLFRDRSFTLNNARVFLNSVVRFALAFLFVFCFQGAKGIDAVLAVVGSGLFNSPNSSLVMGSVAPERRGVAASIRTLLMSVGSVVAIIFTLRMVMARVPHEVMLKVLSGLASDLPGAVLFLFIGGLREAFWLLTIISALSLVLALIMPRTHSTGARSPAMVPAQDG